MLTVCLLSADCAGGVVVQEHRVVEAIANYFNRQIPQLPHNDEDSFLAALHQADLA